MLKNGLKKFKTSFKGKQQLVSLVILGVGVLLFALSPMVARASQEAVTDPCAVFPPVFPVDAPDSFLTFMEHQVPEDVNSALAYYEAVDPQNERLTLNDWLVETGFIDNPTDLQPGVGGDALVRRDAFAMYVNDVDLGVTRRFYSLTDANGNVFIYTENYRCLRDAKLRADPLATVAMEWRAAEDGSNPGKRFVTFYAYGPDNARINEIDLDGRGAKAIPGNCMICHGGNPLALDANGNYPNHGNVGASFLPWDIQAFVFDTTEPSLSRAAQEADIKRLNLAAYATYDKKVKFDQVAKYYRPSALVELVQGWYGGPTFPRATFDDNFVPKGWLAPHAPADGHELYDEVIETSCRSCHIARERSLDFTSYKGFMVFEASTRHLVFDQAHAGGGGGGDENGVMPLALQTFNNFWGSSAPTILLNFLNNH